MESFSRSPERVSHVVVIAVFSAIAIAAVGFRLWSRRVQRSRLEINDYLCVAALIFALALGFFTIHSQIYWDLGGDVTQQGNPMAIVHFVMLQVQAMIVGVVLWVTAIVFIRASILHLYTHIFRKEGFRLVCFIAHGVNLAYFVSTILAVVLICRPISYNWDPTIPGGTCGNQKSLDLYIGISNLLMDVFVLVLPMPVLWGLQMPTSRKVVLSMIFGMGIVICVITMMRVWVTTRIKPDHSNAQKIYSMLALLTCLEALLGVVNCCLPVMRPALAKIGGSKVFSWATSTSWSNGNGSTVHTQRSGINFSKRSKHLLGARAGKPRSHKVQGLSSWSDHLEATESQPGESPGAAKTTKITLRSLQPSMSSKETRQADNGSKIYFSNDVESRPQPWKKAGESEAREGDGKSVVNMPGIMVQRDWDIERSGSDDTERDLLQRQH